MLEQCKYAKKAYPVFPGSVLHLRPYVPDPSSYFFIVWLYVLNLTSIIEPLLSIVPYIYSER